MSAKPSCPQTLLGIPSELCAAIFSRRPDTGNFSVPLKVALFRSLQLVVSILLLAGCSANWHSIYRDKSFDTSSAEVAFVDAKQRAIISAPFTENQNDYLRFCTEPSPDVFSALASSFAAQLSKEEAGNLALRLSSSVAENASTIERTQTVNLLKESMYRICERYLNNGIGRTEMIVQAARDQRMIVSLLAIEQLTGVQKAQAVAITTTAKSGAGGVSNESIAALEKAKAQYEKSKSASDGKRNEADAEHPEITCDVALTSDDANYQTKKALCEEAGRLEKKTQADEAYFNLLKKSVDNLGSVNADAAGQITSASLNGSAASEALARQVVNIVKDFNAFDEIGMTCVVIFRLIADGKLDIKSIGSDLQEACVGRVSAEARLKAAELNKRTQDIKDRMEDARNLQAKAVWNAIVLNGNPDPGKLQALVTKSGTHLLGSERNKLLNAKNLDAFKKAFNGISLPDTQQKLFEATQ